MHKYHYGCFLSRLSCFHTFQFRIKCTRVTLVDFCDNKYSHFLDENFKCIVENSDQSNNIFKEWNCFCIWKTLTYINIWKIWSEIMFVENGKYYLCVRDHFGIGQWLLKRISLDLCVSHTENELAVSTSKSSWIVLDDQQVPPRSSSLHLSHTSYTFNWNSQERLPMALPVAPNWYIEKYSSGIPLIYI